MLEYIEQDRAEGKPFFAYLAYTAPHWPLQAPDESIARFKGRYDAGYEALYASRFARQKELGLVGADAEPIDNARFRPRWSELSDDEKRLRGAPHGNLRGDGQRPRPLRRRGRRYLERSGELDNTFIMFMSDNGAEPDRRDLVPPISEHVGKEYDHSLDNLGRATTYVMYGANWASVSASPFNRHKGTAFEGGVHVPAFVHFPRIVAPGTRSDATARCAICCRRSWRWPACAAARHVPRRARAAAPGQVAAADAARRSRCRACAGRGVRVGAVRPSQRAARRLEDRLGSRVGRKRAALAAVRSRRGSVRAARLERSKPEQLAQLVAAWERYDEENGVVY